jgi:hypothetical protein
MTTHPANEPALMQALAAAVRQHNAHNSRRASPTSAPDDDRVNPLLRLAHAGMRLGCARMDTHRNACRSSRLVLDRAFRLAPCRRKLPKKEMSGGFKMKRSAAIPSSV